MGGLRDRIGNPESVHRVTSPEAYVAWARATHVGLGGRTADVAESGLTLDAYVSDGRWVVRCPCGNGPSAHPEWRIAACAECGAIHKARFPRDWARIEQALLARPYLRWRTCFPTKELAEAHGRATRDTVASLLRGDTAHDSWTAPRTWTTGELVTASMLNVHVRDDLLETAPGKVTTAEDLIVGAGANSLKRVGVGSNGQLLGVASGAVAWRSIDDIYPWRALILPAYGNDGNTNWASATVGAGQWGFGGAYSTGAQNAEISFNVTLAAGTYEMHWVFDYGPDYGQYFFFVDGVQHTGTFLIDGYAAGLIPGNLTSNSGITVTGSGKHVIKFKMSSKNASSTNYVGKIWFIQLRRTA